MSLNRGRRTPSGFSALATHRNALSGSLVRRAGNPWGNPCPECRADRYERCSSGRHDEETGKFIYLKDKPCRGRVTWYPYGQLSEGDDE